VNAGKLLFAQLMDFLPWTSFARSVSRYGGDRRVRSLRCAEQFRAMAFAQLTYRESLRDIEACLNAQPSKLYPMGFHSPVRRSTLAEANESRTGASMPSWRKGRCSRPASSTRRKASAWTSTQPPMRWTRPPSTFA